MTGFMFSQWARFTTGPFEDTTPPTVPLALAIGAVTDSTIAMSWNASQDNPDGSGLKGYIVFRATSQLGVYSRIGTVLAPATFFVDTDLVSSRTYWYKIAAFDAANNESPPGVAVGGTTSIDVTAPTVPTGGLTSNYAGTTMDLDWGLSTDVNGSGVASYRIYRSTTQLGTYLFRASSTVLSYTDTGLIPSTTYWYKVSAVDVAGNESGLSSAFSGTTTAGAIGGDTRRWNPGHYIKTQGADSKLDQAAYWAEVLDGMDKAAAFAPMKGVFVNIAWGAINPTGSTFDWTNVNALFARADSLGQKLIVALTYKNFESTIGLLCPADLRAANAHATSSGWISAVWRPAVMNRFIAACQAFATKYAARSALEAFTWSESSPSFNLPAVPPSDYSRGALSTQLQALTVAAVPMFPTSWVLCNVNSLVGQLTQMINTAFLAGAGFSTPDAVDTNGVRIFRGLTVSGEQPPTHGDLRGRMMHEEIASAPVLGGKDDNGPPSNVINWCQVNAVSHLCWNTTVTRVGHTWTDIKAAITADPLLHMDYPLGSD